MKFPYRRTIAPPSLAFPHRQIIIRPVIPIILEFKGLKVGYEALIDSGADFCIFHAEIADILNINIFDGKEENFGGISGGQSKAYFHRLKMYVSGWPYNFYCGFSPDIPSEGYGVLGQTGFFEQFKVKFDYQKEIIEIKPKE